MAQTTTKRTSAKKPSTTSRPQGTAARRTTTVLDRTVEISDDVLNSVEAGERAAIEAIRKVVDTVDRTLPPYGKGQTRRSEILDSAMHRADRLVDSQHDLTRKLIDSTTGSASRREGRKTKAHEAKETASEAKAEEPEAKAVAPEEVIDAS